MPLLFTYLTLCCLGIIALIGVHYATKDDDKLPKK